MASRVLHDRFELVETLGVGGASTVWLARDRGNGGAEVALKVLHPHLRGDRVIAERFRREVAVLRGLSHPGLVRALEAFEDDEALSFSMERVDGRPLKERIFAAGALTP